MLADFGTYLGRVGESSYSTRVRDVYGEGPTKMGGGSFVAPKVGTAKDFRFTRDKAGRVLYATVPAWPGATADLTTLSGKRIDLSGLRRVDLLGAPGALKYTQDAGALHVTLPAAKPYESPAYVLKLTFDGTGVPGKFGAATPDLRTSGFDDAIVSMRVTFDPGRWFRIVNVTSGLAVDGGGAVAAGSKLKIRTPDESTNLQFGVEDAGDGFFKLTAGGTCPRALR